MHDGKIAATSEVSRALSPWIGEQTTHAVSPLLNQVRWMRVYECIDLSIDKHLREVGTLRRALDRQSLPAPVNLLRMLRYPAHLPPRHAVIVLQVSLGQHRHGDLKRPDPDTLSDKIPRLANLCIHIHKDVVLAEQAPRKNGYGRQRSTALPRQNVRRERYLGRVEFEIAQHAPMTVDAVPSRRHHAHLERAIRDSRRSCNLAQEEGNMPIVPVQRDADRAVAHYVSTHAANVNPPGHRPASPRRPTA